MSAVCIKCVSCSVVDDDESMMSDWLDMVQKKNELVREESELIYRLPSVLILTMFITHSVGLLNSVCESQILVALT